MGYEGFSIMDNSHYLTNYIPPNGKRRKFVNPLQLSLFSLGVFSGIGKTSRRDSGVIKCQPPKTPTDSETAFASKGVVRCHRPR